MPGSVLVTGASGFLGSHLCDVLRQRGVPVRAAHRTTSSLRWLERKGLETVAADLADPTSLDGLLDGCRAVIHCAGVVRADEATYQRVNVGTTEAVLQAASRAGSVEVVVLISSLAAGGPASLDQPRDETHPDTPLTAYGRSKQAAEALMVGRNWPFRTAALRPPALYGPRDREFGPLLRAASRGWTARLGSRMTGLSLVHGRDAATAAVAILETDTANGIYHVDDGPGPDGPRDPGRQWLWGYDWDELQTSLIWLFGRDVRRVTVPLPLLRLASKLAGPGSRRRSPVLHPDRIRDLDTVGWVCTASRLRGDTGWLPEHNLGSGLRDTLDFYRRRGWL